MCLSTVFVMGESGPEELCGYVSSAVVGDGTVTFVDIMGAETVVEGSIASVDLVENKIFVEPRALAAVV